MSIIAALQTYIRNYSGLEAGAPVWVNYLGGINTQYAVVPLAGGKILEAYITGMSEREFPFAFQSMESTADDLERLENAGFYEAFAEWLDAQTAARVFPELGAKKRATLIEATSWGYLYEQGESDTGIYQVTCRLVYEQEP